MIPLLIFGVAAIVVYLAAQSTPQAETIDNTASGYIAPAAANAVPYGRRVSYSNISGSNNFTKAGPHGTGTGQVGRASVYTPPSRDTSLRTSMDPGSNYVPPPANNPVIERPETRPVTVVTPEPRTYAAPVSVSQKVLRRNV